MSHSQDGGAVFQRATPTLVTLHASEGLAPAVPGFACLAVGCMSLWTGAAYICRGQSQSCVLRLLGAAWQGWAQNGKDP